MVQQMTVHILYLCDLKSREPLNLATAPVPFRVATEHAAQRDGTHVIVERDTTWGDIAGWLLEDGPDSSTPLAQSATGADTLWVEIHEGRIEHPPEGT